MASIRLRHSLGSLVLLAVSGGHSTVFALAPRDAPPDAPEAFSHPAHLRYDQVSARVPRELAPIASVALARVNIAMHHARQLAEQQLCAGQWTPQGTLFFEAGPLVTQPEDTGDGYRAWRYQALRYPQALACGDISRTRYFQELSRHLPAWIIIRPGGESTAFRQGLPVASNQPTGF